MNNKILLCLLCIVLTGLIYSLNSAPQITHVDQKTGHIWRGHYDDQGRPHGRCTWHDQAGNLIQEDLFEHGACVFRRRYDDRGSLTLELQEDEDYGLKQTFP
ncbi:MAG: hypothetical protein ACIAZJ_09655 [Gimesia chilikensis]|uniref:hypothetical protein n=1 Tax=Gimesia chilikensis TaxID=2605989 RepID=UPI0037BCD7BF